MAEIIRRIAVNTGGGDAPGLNAVIQAVTFAARRLGWEVYGIREGYSGLLDPQNYPDGGLVRLTRLAAGMEQAGMFRDGVLFVPLARLSDQQSILGAIMDRLRICDLATEEEARRKMLSHLQGRQPLLILDNFEHLLEAGNIRLVLDMIKAAPQSKVLVTSRERMNIHGVTIFLLEGLDVPVEDAAFSLTPETIPPEGFSALELFEQSARRVEPSFRITHENYKVISDICRDVQGIPLAIELAASWLEVLSPQEIKAEISRSLDFLQSDQRDLPDRSSATMTSQA